MSDDFYVYELAYPESMGGNVFYVGKGHGMRLYNHEREARIALSHPSPKCRAIQEIWQASEEVVTRIVYKDLPEPEAFKKERELICLYGRENLTNRTDGGEGIATEGGRKRIQFAITISDAEQDLLYGYLEQRGVEVSDENCREVVRRIAFYGLREVLREYLLSQGSIHMPVNIAAPRPLSMPIDGPYPAIEVG